MARPSTQQSEVARLRLLATSGIDPIEQAPVLADSLRRLMPAFSLSLMRVGDDSIPREHYSEHFDETSHALFATAAAAVSHNPHDPAAFGRLLRNRNPVGSLVPTRPDYVAGAIYQNLFQRNGIHHCLDVAIRDESRPLGILGMFRERDARAFGTHDVATAQTIYPHLVHAFAAEPVAGSYDEVDGAMVVVDARGRILWASPAARPWLEAAIVGPDHARLVERGLVPEACIALARALDRSRPGRLSRTAPTGPPTITLRIPGGRLRLRSYALQAVPGASGPDRAPGHFGIQLSLELHRELRVIRGLEQAPLSPQQRRLALELWRGRGISETAATLGVGTETAKSYRREVLAKLGVASPAEARAALEALAGSVHLDLSRHLPRRGAAGGPQRASTTRV